MKKIFLLGPGLMIAALNVKAMPDHPIEAPYVGINPVMNRCHILAEDNAFVHQGPGETTLTINKNYVLATCKTEYIVDEDNPIEIQGRTDEIPCTIGIPGWAGLEVRGPSAGTGGFNVSQGGVVIATCKAPREQ